MMTFRTTRRMILVALAVVLLATPVLRADQPRPQTLAGTWVYSTVVGQATTGELMTIPGMATYNADGTLTYSDATMLGGSAAMPSPIKFGPYNGVWERTGHNRFGTTGLGLVFDPATNKVIGYARGRSALHYDGDSSKLVGTLYFEFAPCSSEFTCPDPTDPATSWIPFGDPNGFSVVLTRVTRVPAVPLQ
jgi:hypothetical protein